MAKMKRIRDYKASRRSVEVVDLSFLSDRNHRYGWLRRHYKHYRLRRALRKARTIVAADSKVAAEITRYYFIPKSRINIRQNQE